MSTDRPVAVDPWAPFDGHEQVVVARDEATGCELVVAIHSTVLGPALGGVRLSGYTTAASPPGCGLRRRAPAFSSDDLQERAGTASARRRQRRDRARSRPPATDDMLRASDAWSPRSTAGT